MLNVNQVITSLACGQLDEQAKKDYLIVGTNTNVIAYDIDRNVDLFFKEVRVNRLEIEFSFSLIFRILMVHMQLPLVNGVKYPNH